MGEKRKRRKIGQKRHYFNDKQATLRLGLGTSHLLWPENHS